MRQAFWGAYFAAMEQVTFDAATPVYVASGLLTYMDERGALVSSLLICCRNPTSDGQFVA